MRSPLRLIAGATAAIAVVGAMVAILGWWTVYRDRSHPAAPVQIVIERGTTFSQIATHLAEHGVISSALSFRLLARLRHDDLDVRAGAYRFPAQQTQNEVLHALLTGGAQVAVWVTIPEGFTARQIAERLQSAGVAPAAPFEEWFMSQQLTVGGTRTRSLEGFLFPSTYLVPLGASPSQVAKQMTDQFAAMLPADASARARALGVSLPQAVTVASLVEREAKADVDRAPIAGVIYNRLRLGMPLQIDASIEYALPHYKPELSLGDLRIDSPYNTYTHVGLPPAPIANPGLPSLEAALHPAKTDALYYVYCGHGRHVFARTLAEHQANVARCL